MDLVRRSSLNNRPLEDLARPGRADEWQLDRPRLQVRCRTIFRGFGTEQVAEDTCIAGGYTIFGTHCAHRGLTSASPPAAEDLIRVIHN